MGKPAPAAMLVLLMVLAVTTLTHPAQALLTNQPPTPHIKWQTEDLGDWVLSVAWSPSGDMLAAGGYFEKVVVFKLDWGVVRIISSAGSVINVTGPGGSGQYTVPQSGTITLYASPGTYSVEVVYDGFWRAGRVSRSVEVSVGKVVKLDIDVQDFPPYIRLFSGNYGDVYGFDFSGSSALSAEDCAATSDNWC